MPSNPIDLKWKNGGDWNAMMRGGRSSGTTCVVLRSEGNKTYLQRYDGNIEIGDAVQNGIRYYKIDSVQTSGSGSTQVIRSFTVTVNDNNYVPFRTNTTIIILKPNSWGQKDLCLETVLGQIGAYAYMVQYMFNSAVSLQAVNAIPPRFYYPTKHKNLEGFLSLIGQTLRAYWDFPDVVSGLDGFPLFIPQLVQISGVKMWQWVDKKLGYVTSIDRTKKTIKTIPVMQLPCKAMFGRNIFAIARKAPATQRYYLALEPEFIEDFRLGDMIRFYTTANSMTWWDLPPEPTFAECVVNNIALSTVRVQYLSGTFSVGDQLYERDNEHGLLYEVTAVKDYTSFVELALNPSPPQWPMGTVLIKTTKDVRTPGKHALPLIQKSTGVFLSYEKRTPIRLIVKKSQYGWFTAQMSGGTPVVGDVFHAKDGTDLYTITKIENDNYYFTPAPQVSFGNSSELEIVRSVMDFACGITTPAYGQYYLSMRSSPVLYKNMTFTIKGRDKDTRDLIYSEGANWSPADTNGIAYCTHNIYKINDYCYNGLTFPRTMEHLTELLYEYQRLITAMWDQIQIVCDYIANQMPSFDWLAIRGYGQDNLQNDPYWGLFFERLD
jgi:hypothetical protein